MEDSLVINVKEVGVQGGLKDTGEDGNHFGRFLEAPTIYPVQQIEGTVEAQAEEVMGGDGFGFTGFLELEHLGKDGH